MTHDEMKQAAARAALEYVEPGTILGVGTGSTTNCFIDALREIRDRIEGAVASSEATAERLRAVGVPLVDLNRVGSFPVYVDGADEATRGRNLIKGGGGALTREKVLAAAGERFVCIVDASKVVDELGAFPLPIEVIPMAAGRVAREIESMGGKPRLREGFVTDNGNLILDVSEMDLREPRRIESRLDHIAGVVSNGLFCRRPADRLVIGGPDGVETL